MTALTSPLRLEDVTEVLGTTHLNRVAKRYSGEKGLNGKAASRDALIQALDSPARLDALVASLHPVERCLLGELRRHGGVMDGWALYTFARLRGLTAAPVKFNTSAANLFEGYRAATFPGADMIWALLADGLLFPASVPNPWVQNAYAYYHHRPFPDLPASWVLADPRLLSRVPPTEALPVKVTFTGVPPLQRPGAAPSGVLLALRFQELLRGVQLLGGLGVTQAGTYNKSALGKLGKMTPALKDPELWLTLAQHLGLLQADADGRHVQAHPGAAGVLTATDLQQRVSGTVGALHLPEDETHFLSHAGALRACLAALLRDLPHATTERDLLRVMREVIPADLRAQRYDYRQAANPAAWIAWVGTTLRGVMADLGLVVVEEHEETTVLTTNVGMNASRAAQAGPESASPGARPAPPAWILQPNFELLVYPDHLQARQFVILSAAEAARFDPQTVTYRLTRESVYAALERGLNLEELMDGLRAGSATPLSAGMHATIRDWAARRERVTLRQGVTVLEYPSRSTRDAALGKRGTAVGDTLLILHPGQPLPRGITILNYDVAPPKPLKFSADGSFTVTGELDFLTRRLLEGRTEAVRPQQYVIRPAAPGQLPRSFLGDLEARTSTRLPASLRLQLGIWSGAVPPPNVATITVLQHPQAQALAQHPSLKALIGASLSPSLLTVRPGEEAAFETALRALGLSPNREIVPAQDAASDLLVITDTRKKREFLEEAIRNGHELRLQYNEEKYVSSGWNSSRVTTGRRRLDEIRPLRVDRQGSTPYLEARDLKTGDEMRIRVQYILGMAIR